MAGSAAEVVGEGLAVDVSQAPAQAEPGLKALRCLVLRVPVSMG